MSKKRLISILMVAVMVIVMLGACGKKEEKAADPEKEETKVEAEKEARPETAADEEDNKSADSGAMKTEADILTEEDIQSLKNSIRDTVISEYIESNNMSAEEFSWPDPSDADAWEHFAKLIEYFIIEYESGAKISQPESELTESQKIVEAAYNGIINWLDMQGNYDAGYFINVKEALVPYPMTISEIDITSE